MDSSDIELELESLEEALDEVVVVEEFELSDDRFESLGGVVVVVDSFEEKVLISGILMLRCSFLYQSGRTSCFNVLSKSHLIFECSHCHVD